MLTVIGNYIKWCPNKPQSKFALYHLTKCCGKRGQAEQLSINKNVRKYRRCAYVCLPSSCLRAACVCVLWMYVSVNAPVQRDVRSKSACVASPGSKVDGANIFGERTCLKYISIITVISHWHTKTQSPIQMQYCTWTWLTLVIFGMAKWSLQPAEFSMFWCWLLQIAERNYFVVVSSKQNVYETSQHWGVPIEWSGFSIFHLLNLFYSCVSVPLDE